jgi:hypothetical protein
MLHTRVDALTPVFDEWFNKLEIILISNNNIRLSHCLQHSWRDVILTARTYARYDNLSHICVQSYEKSRAKQKKLVSFLPRCRSSLGQSKGIHQLVDKENYSTT